VDALRTFDMDEVDRGSTMGELASATLAAGVDRIVDHDHGIRVGDDDTEYVHQARVATRRLRSDLKTLGDVLDPSWVENRRSELRWLGAVLGAVRDADVLAERLQSAADDAAHPDADGVQGLLDALHAQRDRARSALLEALDADRYFQLLDDLTAAVTQLPVVRHGHGPTGPVVVPVVDADVDNDGRATRAAPLGPSTPAVAALPQLLDQRWRKLRRAVRDAGEEPTDEQLHQVRIRAKQLRYAAEAAEPVLGKRTQRLAVAAAELQTVLGDLHDAVTADSWLRQVALASTPQVAFAAGQLSVIEQQQRAHCRATWHRPWKGVAQQARRLSGAAAPKRPAPKRPAPKTPSPQEPSPQEPSPLTDQ
jgi:CHAD domain-containing protein